MKKSIISDPAELDENLPRLTRKRRRIVALDLATNCGVAIMDYTPGHEDKPQLIIGQWDLSLGDFDSGPLRHIRLMQLLEVAKPSMVAHEDVKFAGMISGPNVAVIVARAAKSAEFIGGLKTTVATWCEVNNVPCVGYPIGTIKKHATGKGNANKMDIIKAAAERFGLEFPKDEKECMDGGYDNMADASFIAELAFREYADGLKYLEQPRGKADST